MKSKGLFFAGLGVNAIVLLIAVSKLGMMQTTIQGLDATAMDGMTGIGRVVSWLIPVAIITLAGTAFWLKSTGKMLAANILIWIPALPILAVILMWGGLAVLFILFVK